MRTAAFAIVVFLASRGMTAPLGGREVAIRDGCEAADGIVATVPDSTPLRITSAVSFGATCYAVTVAWDGKNVEGYTTDAQLPAIASFERQRAEAARLAALAPPLPATKPGNKPAAPASYFRDFASKDISGHPVRLSSLGAKVILVTFWSPSSRASRAELSALGNVYGEFHLRGLEAVGVGKTASDLDILRRMDDLGVDWPQIADKQGLAREYNVAPDQTRTFVLDADRRILASDLHGQDLAVFIQKLFATAR